MLAWSASAGYKLRVVQRSAKGSWKASICAGLWVMPRLVWGAPGAPPPTASADQEPLAEITVIAARPPTAEELTEKHIASFVRSHGNPGRRLGQLGRWDKALCVSTVGLTPGLNDFVTARVQAIAASVAPHLAQAKAGACTPDVYVVFTTEPQTLMNNVAKTQPQLLGFHEPQEVPKLKTIDRPVQAWYVTATAGLDRVETVVDDMWHTLPAGELNTRLRTGMSSLIQFALVVIDTKKVDGYTIGSISDYVAMVTLSQVRFGEGCGDLPSILDMLAPGCQAAKSDSITAGDLAYLRALYLVRLDQAIGPQRVSIEDAMMRLLKAQ